MQTHEEIMTGGGAATKPVQEPWRNLELLLAERRRVSSRAEAGWRATLRRGPLRLAASPFRRGRRALDRLWVAQRLRLLSGAGRLLGAQRIVRALPAFRGSFELDLQSDVTRNLLLGKFETALTPILEVAVRRGDVIDVGANVGLYTVLLARLLGPAGRVLAIEPAPSVLSLLKANLARNDLPQVLVFEGVAAAEPGRVTLHVMEGNEEYASIGGHNHPLAPRRAPRRIQVPAETLDNLAARHRLSPSFLKIDAEGAEGLVLSGAARLLREARPVVLSELDDRLLKPLGWDAARVRRLLGQAGYRIFDAYSGAEQPEAGGGPCIGEIVAIPR